MYPVTQTPLKYHRWTKVRTNYQMLRILFSISPGYDLKLHRSSPKPEAELHALLHPGMAISSYVLAGATTQSSLQYFNEDIHYRTTFLLPTQSVIRREIDLTPSIQELEEWAQSTGVRPGPLVPSLADRESVLRLFYTVMS